jgi:FixJ family two-component response regulator
MLTPQCGDLVGRRYLSFPECDALRTCALVSPSLPTVSVVDNDASVRESLETMIHYLGWRPQTFRSAEEFLERPRVLAQSCLILNITPPDLNGFELQKFIANRMEMPVILLSGRSEASMIVKAMKAGAFDFFTKPFDVQTLMSATGHALARSHAALRQEAELHLLRDRYESLSTREREVMSLVVSGLLNKVIGRELGISEITVKQHRGRAMRKMSAKSLPDLVHMAAKLALS